MANDHHLSGSWLLVERANVLHTHADANLEDMVLMFEVPTSASQIGGAVGSYVPVKVGDLLPDWTNPELAHVCADVFWDLASTTVSLLRKGGHDPDAFVAIYYTNAHNAWGVRVTHRFWIAYKKSVNELHDAGVHPDDVIKSIVDDANKELESYKAKHTKETMAAEDKFRKLSTIIDLALTRGFSNVHRMGPFYHDECPQTWTRTCPSLEALRFALCRFTRTSPLAIPTPTLVTTLFRVRARLAASGTLYDARPIECSMDHCFPIVDGNYALDLHLGDRADARVYRIVYPEDFLPGSRNRFLFPYATFYHTECIRLRSIELTARMAVVNVLDEAEEDAEASMEPAYNPHMCFNLPYPKGDMYNTQRREHANVLHVQANKPQYWEQIKVGVTYVDEYCRRMGKSAMEAKREKLSMFVHSIRAGNPMISDVCNQMLSWGERRMLRPKGGATRPAGMLMDRMDKPISLGYDANIDGACLHKMIDIWETMGVRVNHFSLMLTYLSTMDTHFYEFTMKFHMLFSGGPSVGKSVIISLLATVLLHGSAFAKSESTSTYGMLHDLGCTGATNDKLQFRDDVALDILVNPNGSETSDAQCQVKEILTSGKTQRTIGHINDRGNRELRTAAVDNQNAFLYIMNESIQNVRTSPSLSRFYLMMIAHDKRADGANVDLVMQHLNRNNDDSDALLHEYFYRTVDWFHCQHYIVMVVIKAISCNVLTDVNTELAEQMFERTATAREKRLSHVGTRDERARLRYIRLCRVMTIFLRVMQLYFIEGAPFWGVPFNMIDQFPVLEATLITSEQIAVFAFSLMKDEWCDSLSDEIIDCIYVMYVHKDAPMRGNKPTQAIHVIDGEKDDPTVSTKRRKTTLSEPTLPTEKGESDKGEAVASASASVAVSASSETITLRWHRKKIEPYQALEMLAGEIVTFCESTMSTGSIVFDRKTIKDALNNMCNTQQNGLIVLTQNPVDEKVELTLSKELFGQIRTKNINGQQVDVLYRSRHGGIMDMCKESVRFKHAHPGPYVVGTPSTFPMPLNEPMKKRLLCDQVTRVINQYCGFLQGVPSTDEFPPLRSTSKRPNADHMKREFASMGMAVAPGTYVQSSIKTYTENPVIALQKKRLETLGISMEEAERRGILLGTAGMASNEAKHLQRLVKPGGVSVTANPSREAVKQTIIRKALQGGGKV